MGKSFYMGGAWAAHELRWREEENRYEDYEGLPQVERSAGGRTRRATAASVAGFDSRDFHYKGDPVNILRETPLPGGDVAVTFERRDAGTGQCRGSYVTTLRKTADGRIETAGTRRTFSL
jgi:hypothetical protein